MGKVKQPGAEKMPKVDTAQQSAVFKAPPRRLRMSHPPTPPPAPARDSKKTTSKKS